ncbi:hypothetical protein G6F23_015610 [Rhizopus arrhizus]|nr:hypothetical protein G6F23_015610 [Rhizopus arrhizus]
MSTTLSQSGPLSFLRRTSPLDALLAEADRALRVLSNSATAGRPYPAKSEEAPNAMRCTGGRRRSAANSRPARCC